MKWEGYQTIKRIKIEHILILFGHLWKLANENLPYTMLSHDTTLFGESYIQLTFTLQSVDWFTSWSCFCCFKIQNQCLTKKLPWLLCSVNHSSILLSSSRYFGMKHPIVFHFTDNLIFPLKRFPWSFLQWQTINSLMPFQSYFQQLLLWQLFLV